MSVIMGNQDKIYVDWIGRVKVLQKAVIFNENGRILALKKTDDPVRPNPGCWDLAGGRVESSDIVKWKNKSGKGDDNDILINALRREIKEETGLEVKNICAIHAASAYSESKEMLIVAIGYSCKAADERRLKLSAEHTEFRWAAKEEFMRLEIGNDDRFIESFLDKL